jgi:hypothetical protein
VEFASGRACEFRKPCSKPSSTSRLLGATPAAPAVRSTETRRHWSPHGHRSRSLLGTFGPVKVEVPRARLNTADGKTTEWKSRTLRAYQRRTLAADALIASCYLAGTNTRRVRRALGALFAGAVGKDTVSRVWRKVKSDWERGTPVLADADPAAHPRSPFAAQSNVVYQ